MASKPPITKTNRAKFMKALLAPLPAGEEPVETKKFLRALRDEMRGRWEAQFQETSRAKHTRLALVDHCSPSAIRGYWKAVDAQMRIPAPTKAAMAWKVSHETFNGGCYEWSEAIVRDEYWLARLEKAGVR